MQSAVCELSAAYGGGTVGVEAVFPRLLRPVAVVVVLISVADFGLPGQIGYRRYSGGGVAGSEGAIFIDGKRNAYRYSRVCSETCVLLGSVALIVVDDCRSFLEDKGTFAHIRDTVLSIICVERSALSFPTQERTQPPLDRLRLRRV